ncbi:alpha/beta-hydrolase [Agrocybe pediades]|nr:alpha/beta-hydrolase [Agrocybe pediades]
MTTANKGWESGRESATTAPYGTWESPIHASSIAKKAAAKEDVLVDTVSSKVYYIESRAMEDGRNVMVDAESGVDLFERSWNARSRVQEYGGAPAVVHDGVLLFSNFSDCQVYVVDLKLGNIAEPRKVTTNAAHRFADFAVHPLHPNLVVCSLEDHTIDVPSKVENSLVTIDTTSGSVSSLISGSDFYSSPRFNADGTVLAWCQWDHPDMPLDSSQIFLVGIQAVQTGLKLCPGKLPATRVAGEPRTISAVQPNWIDNDSLAFCCDVSGYHVPWIARLKESTEDLQTSVDAHPLLEGQVNDYADPPWTLGSSNCAVLDKDHLLFSASSEGRHALRVVDFDGAVKEVDCPYVHIQRLRRVSERRVIFLGTQDKEPKALIECSFDGNLTPSFNRVGPTGLVEDPATFNIQLFISVPEFIKLEILEPRFAGRRAIYLMFYPPHNPRYVGPDGEKPCAIVNVHGGPGSIEPRGLKMEKQYFTSRGWAWIDVNYGGSSNFGREHIERLKGNWGVMDVEDCVYAAKELSCSARPMIDPKRIMLRGGSAGGFTTLCTLCQLDPSFQVFAAGTSSYGISDLKVLSEVTHKFQSHYVQSLLGGTYEEIPEVYRSRSAVFHARNIKVPLLILQGSDDVIVPPSQAEAVVNAIREKGGQVEYLVFAGEGHGWRQATTIQTALETEARFYEKVLHLIPEAAK